LEAGAREEEVTAFTESIVEDAALAWLEALRYAVLYGPASAAYGVRIVRSARFVPEVAE
jgi:hypothetical protein